MSTRRAFPFVAILLLGLLLPAAWAAPAADWQPAGMLCASDGGMTDRFGNQVALWNDTAVVGAANWDSATAGDVGAAYVFTHNGVNWTPAAAPPRDSENEFEIDSIALAGDRLILGITSFPTAPFNGRFLIYRRDGASWVAEPAIVQPDNLMDTGFGSTVALNDKHFLAGAPYLAPSDVYDQGGVYVFRSDAEVVFTLFAPVVAAPPAE